MRPIDLPSAESFPHGTRSRYVCGCRCADCNEANLEVHRDRVRKVRAAAGDVVPNAFVWKRLTKTSRKGKEYEIQAKACGGVNRKPCVRGGAFLHSKLGACVECIARATVWNGLVDAGPARAHLLALRAKGVGYKSVSAACDVAPSSLSLILSGALPKIRARTERAILRVDEGARGDAALVDAAASMDILEQILARGFTRGWIAHALGNKTRVLQFTRARQQITASSAARIERLLRRIETEKLEPPTRFARVPAAPTQRKLRELIEEEGFTQKELGKRLGITINNRMLVQPWVRVETERLVDRFLRELNAEGDELAEDNEDRRAKEILAAVRAGERSAEDIAADYEVTSRTVERIKARARNAEAA